MTEFPGVPTSPYDAGKSLRSNATTESFISKIVISDIIYYVSLGKNRIRREWVQILQRVAIDLPTVLFNMNNLLKVDIVTGVIRHTTTVLGAWN